MSHHFSFPDSGFPDGDARLDLTDLYAFPKPGDTGKSIFVMNVHPSVGENLKGPTTTQPFAPEALYELKIDTNGDAVADIAYRLRLSSSADGAQVATLRGSRRGRELAVHAPTEKRRLLAAHTHCRHQIAYVRWLSFRTQS